MPEDFRTQEQEAEIEEIKQRSLLREAAIHVINGMTRDDAVRHIQEKDYLRSEAESREQVVRDEDGMVESYLDSELEPPTSKGLNDEQINAIHRDLCADEGISSE